jgi:hypothetical protein
MIACWVQSVTPDAERPAFTIVLRPEPGVDGTRALRRLLRYALRVCGLRCVRITCEQALLEKPAQGRVADEIVAHGNHSGGLHLDGN